MIKTVLIAAIIVFLNAPARAQLKPVIEQMLDAEKAFEKVAAEKGPKTAFLEFLTSDSVYFHPEAVNGIKFWTSSPDSTSILLQNTTYADTAFNGRMGYTTGTWELFPKGRAISSTGFGEFVTIWQKGADGRFKSNIYMGTLHDKIDLSDKSQKLYPDESGDANNRGWSAADTSMNFLRAGMTQNGLGQAFQRFAGDDIRLLIDGSPPINGKKNVVKAMSTYMSVDFPKSISLFQTSDMAYAWNRCEFANSVEGKEVGNCLQIWKLRNKKWWNVLSVFARERSDVPPNLIVKRKSLKNPKQD